MATFACWKATVGAGGTNGSATLRALDTGAGTIALSLRRLAASATGSYPVVVGPLEAGRYRVRAEYPGDSARWPALVP